MSRYIVIKETGADNVLLIDKETRTVEEVDASTLDSFLEEGADGLRDNAFRGIEAAVAFTAARRPFRPLVLQGRLRPPRLRPHSKPSPS